MDQGRVLLPQHPSTGSAPVLLVLLIGESLFDIIAQLNEGFAGTRQVTRK